GYAERPIEFRVVRRRVIVGDEGQEATVRVSKEELPCWRYAKDCGRSPCFVHPPGGEIPHLLRVNPQFPFDEEQIELRAVAARQPDDAGVTAGRGHPADDAGAAERLVVGMRRD